MPYFKCQIENMPNRMIKNRGVEPRITSTMRISPPDGGKTLLVPITQCPTVLKHSVIGIKDLNPVQKLVTKSHDRRPPPLAIRMSPH